jgi:hypothetical protein
LPIERLLERHLAIEGQVKVDEVNAFVLDVLAEDIEVITKEQLVHDEALRRGKVLSALITNKQPYQDICGLVWP